jgi:hypothetical protein
MKCPKCQAKLLPVDGVMFCLQCGNAVPLGQDADRAGPALEDTTDPLLRKAIVDAARHPVTFKSPVVVAAVPAAPAKTSMVSMRSLLAAPVAVSSGSAAAVMAPPARIVGPIPAAAPVEAAAAPQTGARLRPWIAGLAAFVLFVGLNVLIDRLLADRVYPGVRVGATEFGGTRFEDLPARLTKLAGSADLKVYAGNDSYTYRAGELGSADQARLEREVKSIGHSTPLPLAGLIEALLARPVKEQFSFNETELKSAAAGIAQEESRPASDSVPMIVSGQAFAISAKDGAQIGAEAVEVALRNALPSGGSVNLKPSMVKAQIASGDYKADVDAAQARIGLSIQVRVRGAAHAASVSDVGSWLYFLGPGKGVGVDGAAVSNYIAGIPGRFDRVAAVNAVVQAVTVGNALSYNASTAAVTSAPALPSHVRLPIYTYTYCTRADGSAGGLSQAASQALRSSGAWAIGGRLRFTGAQSACAFTLRMVPESQMVSLNPECTHHTTCLDGARLLISHEAWEAPPAGWSGGPAAYRAELINHEVGHWLGFDHASCTQKSAAPILAAPTLTLSGCSPNWYEIPVEMQGTKPLAGF